MRQRRKARGGSQIAELAPALLILFIVVLFPMLDVMYLALGYCAGWYLNHITSRGCSTVAWSGLPGTISTGGPYPAAVITNLNNVWLGTSFSSFCGASIVSNAASAVPVAGVPDPSSNANALPTMMVQATTSVQVHPFFTLPVMPLMNSLQVDGLTRPVTFTYSDRVPVQENGIN
jgi:hypothetical protein